jgi:hypothetical protein
MLTAAGRRVSLGCSPSGLVVRWLLLISACCSKSNWTEPYIRAVWTNHRGRVDHPPIRD